MEITFDKLWHDIVERSQRFSIPIVQDYKELEYVFNLLKTCGSYLEVGTAEGNGLYVLAHALSRSGLDNANNPYIEIIDFGEKHTDLPRREVLNKLDYGICQHLGNSHSADIVGKTTLEKYDAVFIDAGHSYEDVIADAIAYGHLATKYIFFHDIQLPPVRKAYEWYAAQNPQMKKSEFINSPNFGYGILEI